MRMRLGWLWRSWDDESQRMRGLGQQSLVADRLRVAADVERVADRTEARPAGRGLVDVAIGREEVAARGGRREREGDGQINGRFGQFKGGSDGLSFRQVWISKEILEFFRWC